jgi:hypothetical protein
MIAVEKTRDIEIRADVLNDDVRRVAPAAGGDVTVWKRKAFERSGVHTPHNLDARAHVVRKPAGFERVQPVEIGAERCRNGLLSRSGTVLKLRTQRCPRALVDAE